MAIDTMSKPLLTMLLLVLWVDAIIDPSKQKSRFLQGIEAANNAPLEKAYNPGIIQRKK